VAEVLGRYRANPNVHYAEPDYVVETSDTIPNDAQWGNQWDMNKISAPLAWDTQQDASEIVVAIIDTGIDFTHPDLQGNLWTSGGSHGFTCINGPCVPGGQDDHGHGTHVAGTIGAASNNLQGIAGINWHVQMIAFKFLNSEGSGYISDAIYAFQKIAELRASGVNIRLTSNSWGGGGYSETLKGAMAAVEAVGIVNVCAAGNSGQNADAWPMYPAAYDNRGIISVAATDINDNGASFTNYGLATVDLAAPGVRTLSTVPTGTCSLCDPSGYKYLSGTSMATPHVSGVMAALMHLNPSLTAEEARDVILDPSSYDVMTDAKAKSTSTGGRLNFSKAISSSRLYSPEPLNNFPTLTMGPDIFAPANTTVTLSATASDPDPADNANLRMSWSRATSTSSMWLFGWMLGSLFPNPSEGSTSFTTPALARTAVVPYYAGVADNRGGGATDSQNVIVAPTSPQAGPPSGTLSLSTTSAAVGSTITVSFPVVDPDAKGTPAWDLWAAGRGGSKGWCCYTGSAVKLTFSTAGVYRISTQAIDRALDLSGRQTAVVSIGGAKGIPPIASVTLDKLEGQIPLTVNIDMSASSDPDGSIQYYYIRCGGDDFTVGSTSPKGKCTFSAPGTYWLLLQVQDNSGQMDLVSAYVVATPPGGSIGLDAPTGLTAMAGSAEVLLSWQASSGANSYKVKRATTSGGPYTNVATVTATNYVDTGLTNGTTYYYMISAVNASGESSNSVKVLAKLVASALNSLTLSPYMVKGGATSTGTITLSSAPLVDEVVNLSSSAPSVASVPLSVTVTAGSQSAGFTITAHSVTSRTRVIITATLDNVSRRQRIYVIP
jgi:subtilisin family serine protease